MTLSKLPHSAAAALFYANEAHRGQKRKWTGRPYIEHPIAVAMMVRSVTADPDAICAALLHDVVEDTDRTLDEIRVIFGGEIADLVEMLTDVSTPEDGSREKRKALDRAHLAAASPKAKTVKLADLISNTSSIVEHDPRFARIYLEEKRLLLPFLVEGDPRLYEEAERQLSRSEEALSLIETVARTASAEHACLA